MVNNVTLVGRLGQNPEVRHLESGAVVAKFSIATTERIKKADGTREERTEWHDVVCWRKLAEIAEQYLTKGKLVYIEGKLTHRKWQDKEGNPRKTTEVVCNNFQMLDRGPDASNQSGTMPSNRSAEEFTPKTATPVTEPPANIIKKEALASEIKETPDDELPF